MSFAQFDKYLQRFDTSSIVASRLLSHIVIAIVIGGAILLSQMELTWHNNTIIQPLQRSTQSVSSGFTNNDTANPDAISPLTVETELNSAPIAVIRGAVPRTIIPERIEEEVLAIKTYTVESGDTIIGIAAKVDLAPETLMWANPSLEGNPDLLYLGQELTILPVDGVYHQVGGGDTIDAIAATYKADSQAIIDYPLNGINPEEPIIQAGGWVIVPGGSKPIVPKTVVAYSGPIPEGSEIGSGIFSWPATGALTQGYWSAHPGIDVAGWLGAPIIASDSGHVIEAGWDNTGYGYFVVIDHGNGFQTLYAHLQAYYVEAGVDVAKGQQIAEMGSTGNSSGPHLHFEMRQGAIQRNPIGFLP